MEIPKHHEIVRPMREIANSVLEKLGDWCIGDALTGLINGVEQESAQRTTQMFTQGQLEGLED